LLGKDTAKIKQHGHTQLSVFGIGTGKPVQVWRSAIRQLVVQGCLRVDPERFGALVLTDSSRSVLRGEETLRLREDPAAPRGIKGGSKSGGKSSRSSTHAADIPADDIPLWEALRECRQRLALENNVPPYVIFHDKTLRQMLSERTADASAFLHLSGVGQAKLERYGDEFMAVIREHG
jgi:ATP-dependent DNA helicase RecQ